MSKGGELIKNTLIIAIGKLSTQFLSFLLLPLYTTFLSTKEFGTVDLIMTYVAITVPLMAISVERAVFRHLIDVRKNHKKQTEVITNAIIIYGAGLALLTVIFTALNFVIAIPHIWIVYAVIVAVSFSNFFMQVARGFGDNVKFSVASVIAGVTTIVLNILLIVGLHWGAEGMLVATAVANIICGTYLVLALNLVPKFNIKTRSIDVQKQLIGYSAPLVPSNMAWWAISAADRTIIAFTLGPVANGIYAAAYKFPQVFSGLFSFFSMSWQESASMHINSKDRDKFYSQTMDATIRLFGGLGICIVAGTGMVFNILVGAAFHDARQYIPILILGVFFSAVLDIYSGVYIAKKMTKQVFKTSLIAAIINITFTLCTISQLGLYAPAIAMCVSYLSMSIMRHYDLQKHVAISYNLGTILMVAAFAAVVGGLYYCNTATASVVALIVAIAATCVLNQKMIKTTWKLLQRKIRRS